MRKAHTLQRVVDSLRRLSETAAIERLQHVREPGRLKVDYEGGEWSPCSLATCEMSAASGVQLRVLRCRVALRENATAAPAYVEDEICEIFGAIRPPASQSCRPEHCPHAEWESSDWSDVSRGDFSSCPRLSDVFFQCSESRCLQNGLSVSVNFRPIE